MKRKRLTGEAAAIECHRIVAELERTRSPYQMAVFWQRVDRGLNKRRHTIQVLPGGCMLIKPKFKQC